jgi:hypothetical protein
LERLAALNKPIYDMIFAGRYHLLSLGPAHGRRRVLDVGCFEGWWWVYHA